MILFCTPLFIGLGRTDLRNDESIYSFAVDKILETGDWLTPKSSPRIDIAFLEKPPLKFWIVAAPIALGILPHDEFGLRFWDAVMGAAAFLYVFAIGRALAGPVCGFVSALILFVHGPLLFEHGLRSNNMEAPLLLAYAGGVYHYLRWADADRSRRRAAHAVALTLLFVLGFMTKFVAALLLAPLLGCVAVLRADDRARLLQDWRLWIVASALFVALVAPWFVYQWRQFGPAVWEIMLGTHVYTRFTRFLDPNHVHPWHYYFSTLFKELLDAHSLPLVLPGAALLVVTAIVTRRREELLVLAWFVVPVSLISLGTSKLYHYVYPFLPAVALAGGYLAARLLQVLPPRLTPYGAALDSAVAATIARRAAWLARPGVRRSLDALALAGVGIGVATLIWGGVDFKVGGVRLLRNASTIRPLAYALVFAALGARLRLASLVAAPLLVLYLLPLTPYFDVWPRLWVEDHPKRSARDCLIAVNAPGAARPGLYVDVPSDSLDHSHHYYFDPLGPWEQREPRSDAALFAPLFVAAKQRPVLVWGQRYRDLVCRLQERDRVLYDEIERAGPVPRETLESAAVHWSAPMVVLGDQLLVTPGRFSACGR